MPWTRGHYTRRPRTRSRRRYGGLSETSIALIVLAVIVLIVIVARH